uniref:Nematode cuticle collagen N-terminal domain-containing protein n=1 Tax=Pristionchus pacificus TaxID=54126 RepID=A0A8R1UGV3_PRIPA
MSGMDKVSFPPSLSHPSLLLLFVLDRNGYKDENPPPLWSLPLSIPTMDCSEAAEQRQLRRVAFFAVVVSTVAVIASVVTLPMLYSYVASFQSHLIIETEFCKTRTRDIWAEMHNIDVPRLHRSKRQYGSSPPGAAYSSPVVNSDASVGCCGCQQGPAGPPGPPGDSGPDGNDGGLGRDGQPGRDGSILVSAVPTEPCIICPPGPSGPQGMGGNKGPTGPKGRPGAAGNDGKAGGAGMSGSLGMMGPGGRPGVPGPRGSPGRVIQVNGPPGSIGSKGPRGAPGPRGEAGFDGGSTDGAPGPKGNQGRQGPPGGVGPKGPIGGSGPRGQEGTCEHCPLPRTPPGY